MPYKLDPLASIADIAFATSVLLAPALLVRRFGIPERPWEPKLSGQYIFVHSRTGNVFTLYDWKATNLWERGLPRPDELWAETEPFEFNVGATEEGEAQADDFVRWLRKSLVYEIH